MTIKTLCTTACPSCTGRGYHLRRPLLRVYLFGEAVTPEFFQVTCGKCKGTGQVSLEAHAAHYPAAVNGVCPACGVVYQWAEERETGAIVVCEGCGVVGRMEVQADLTAAA